MKLTPLFAGALLLALCGSASAQTLTIATVNNGDMIRMSIERKVLTIGVQLAPQPTTAHNPILQLCPIPQSAIKHYCVAYKVPADSPCALHVGIKSNSTR